MLQEMALNSPVSNKHSACLLRGDRVFAYGVNKHLNLKTPAGHSVNFAIHAEIDALSNVHSRILKGMDILVIRTSKTKVLGNSRPCNHCIDKLKQRGIRKAYYSNAQGEIVYEFVEYMEKIHESSGHRYRKTCMLS